jgi:hypothetical protein
MFRALMITLGAIQSWSFLSASILPRASSSRYKSSGQRVVFDRLCQEASSSSNPEINRSSSQDGLNIDLKKRKVSVCTDMACEQQGAYDTLEDLRAALRKTPRADIASVNEMGCPGRCGNGPIIEIASKSGDVMIVEDVKSAEAVQEILEGSA